MKIKPYAIWFVFIIILVSCAHTPKPKVVFPDIEIRDSVKEIDKTTIEVSAAVGDASTNIRAKAEEIKEVAETVEKTVPREIQPPISPSLISIQNKADEIIDNTNKLDAAKVQLESARSKLSKTDIKIAAMTKEYKQAVKEVKKAQDERDEAVAEERAATRRMIRWMIGLSVIGIGLGAALIFFGHLTMGSGLVVLSVTVVVLGVVIDKYYDWIALGGVVVVAIAVGFIIYQFFIREKAVEEVVETAEVAKKKLNYADRKIIFGEGVEPGMAVTLQSKSTEHLVNRVRRKKKHRWEPTVTEEVFIEEEILDDDEAR
jgi:hypothetical protein|tara:strand:+ start:5258 stop:6205 length:948 start_codon:yes stop_codon:yes gene_type:complete